VGFLTVSTDWVRIDQCQRKSFNPVVGFLTVSTVSRLGRDGEKTQHGIETRLIDKIFW